MSTPRKFRICYVIEFAGTSKLHQGFANSLLELSVEEVMATMLDAMGVGLINSDETLKIKLGKIDCSDLDDIKIKEMVTSLKLKPSTLFFKRRISLPKKDRPF